VRALEGKRALIVGAGSGIGRGVFDAFQSAGALVGALELSSEKCAELDSGDGVVIEGDATSRADNEAAVEAVVDTFGGLDILVNCVGLFDYYQGLGEVAEDQFDEAFAEVMNVNVRSHLLSVKASLEHLRASRGSITLTLSTSSFAAGRGGILYVASKFALRGCVVSLAHELAPDIRVKVLRPVEPWGLTCEGFLPLASTINRWAPGLIESRVFGIEARSMLHSTHRTTRRATCSWPPMRPEACRVGSCTPTAERTSDSCTRDFAQTSATTSQHCVELQCRPWKLGSTSREHFGPTRKSPQRP